MENDSFLEKLKGLDMIVNYNVCIKEAFKTNNTAIEYRTSLLDCDIKYLVLWIDLWITY